MSMVTVIIVIKQDIDGYLAIPKGVGHLEKIQNRKFLNVIKIRKNKQPKQNSTKGGKDNEDNNVDLAFSAIQVNQPHLANQAISMSDIILDIGAYVHVVPDWDLLTNF